MKCRLSSALAPLLLAAAPLALMYGQVGNAPGTRIDQYGGVYKVAPGTGYFRTLKSGNRWLLVTPEGNAFFMLGVYNVTPNSSKDDLGGSYRDRVIKKYGDADLAWGPQMNRRLLRWGFNSLEIYSLQWALPFATHPRWPGRQQPVKLPFVLMVYPASYSLFNLNHWAPAPTKDLYNGLPVSYRGWKASFPDVFDPNFGLWLEGALKYDTTLQPAFASASRSWIIGVTCDDTDNLNGYGPGPSTPGRKGTVAPHLGWISLVTNFEQTGNSRVRQPQTYADRKVYTKYSLRDWLRKKYGSIDALNSAWKAQYTNWDSDGGWGQGSGFLDEDGRHSWVGNDWNSLRTASAGVKADLDEWLYVLATQHLRTCRERIKRVLPNVLFMGPSVMNTHWGVTRPQILKAYGEQADVVSVTWRDNQQYLDLTASIVGDKPLISWNGAPANLDSAFWRYSGAQDDPRSQTERGRLYEYWLTRQFDATVSATGVHPLVGFRWWEFCDNWREKTNWGLVSPSDNPYDGRASVQRAGTDQWGYPTGGEERDYGDFIGPVQRTNQQIMQRLFQELQVLYSRDLMGKAREAGAAQ